MIEFWLLGKGLLAGVAIAAPVGPVNVLCASRTLSRGRLSGMMTGLGAATADAFYGGIAGFSITLVIDFLRREEFWIRVLGGLLLVGIGMVYLRKPPQPLQSAAPRNGANSDFVSTLLLTLTNPTTILSFIAVLTALGTTGHRIWWHNFLLVAGIFCGSMFWWTILVFFVNRLRNRFDDHTISWMNRIAGLAIGAFGMITFALGVAMRK